MASFIFPTMFYFLGITTAVQWCLECFNNLMLSKFYLWRHFNQSVHLLYTLCFEGCRYDLLCEAKGLIPSTITKSRTSDKILSINQIVWSKISIKTSILPKETIGILWQANEATISESSYV